VASAVEEFLTYAEFYIAACKDRGHTLDQVLGAMRELKASEASMEAMTAAWEMYDG
jgi:hypothetical protein